MRTGAKTRMDYEESEESEDGWWIHRSFVQSAVVKKIAITTIHINSSSEV